jgi:hypothetical protein
MSFRFAAMMAEPDAGYQPSNTHPGTPGRHHPPRPAQSPGCVTHDRTFLSSNSSIRSSTVAIAASTAAATGSLRLIAPSHLALRFWTRELGRSRGPGDGEIEARLKMGVDLVRA